MYLLSRTTTFLVLLLHQCIVNGFNIFNIDMGLNYLNRQMNSVTPSLAPDEDIMTRWIQQELDHFNSKDNRTFAMKYLEGLKYAKVSGPIYLFLSVQESADDFWAKTGLMYDLAKETHGAMYILEQRYYGDSKPFTDLDTENIKYLNSRQALADVAKLLSYLKSLPMHRDSKVVVIGYLYGGQLAAWMKVLYPNLIDAAISSGAKVLALKDFYKYLENVKDTYVRYGGTECLDKITKKFENYDSLLQSPEGILQLKRDENICEACDMTVRENQQLFFFFRTLMLSLSLFNLDSITDYCKYGNDKNVYSGFLSEYTNVNSSKDKQCWHYNFQALITDLKDNRNLDRFYTKIYQSCTEFGQFPTTSSQNQPFLNIPLEFYIKTCSELFGNNFNEKRVDEGVEITNKLYGGLKPNVTKVVFTNGDLDPRRSISILEDLSPDAQAVLIPGVNGGRDLLPDSERDSKELKEARDYVKYLIKKWIRQEKK